MGLFSKLFGNQPPSAPPAKQLPDLPAGAIAVRDGISAHFKQPKGPSRPGIGWAVRIGGTPTTSVFVRTFYRSNKPDDSQRTEMAKAAADFIRAKLESGWRPGADDVLDVELK